MWVPATVPEKGVREGEVGGCWLAAACRALSQEGTIWLSRVTLPHGGMPTMAAWCPRGWGWLFTLFLDMGFGERVCLPPEVTLTPSHFILLLPAGRNEKGQLGHGDTKRVEAPKLIEGLSHEVIVSVACGRNHTLALTGKGPQFS